MKYEPARRPLTGETLGSLSASMAERGEKPFRARQVLDWVYKKRARSWDEMTNLPKALRSWLDAEFTLMPASLVMNRKSADVTDKLLLELGDRSLVETVIIRAPQDGVGLDHSRKTICISTQVGCAMGCVFCASGLAGLRRDMLAGEIVAQLLQVCYEEDARTPRARAELASFDNIVVMGMGEPLANYDALIRALTIVNAPWGLGFGARRITVSTSGLVPKIIRLADEPLGFRLAVSLHGATDEVRTRIMPVNKAFPLGRLIPAVRTFSERHGRMVTLEFILIEDVNDSEEQARALRDIAADLHAHVNLIPYNTVDGLPWKRPSPKRQAAFAAVLERAGVSVTLRREKGHDIAAACGQLRLREERGALENSS
jgi:23S rRNA (adenine2503-C2)-methyltransferase